MASVADAIKVIAEETGEAEAAVAQVARYLVNIGDLPKNVGRRVSSVDEGHIALLLLAIYTATTHTSAPARAREYGSLRWDGHPDGTTFLSFLTGLLTDLRTDPEQRIRIGSNPEARISIGDDLTVHSGDLIIEIILTYPLVIVSAPPPIFAPLAFESFGFSGTGSRLSFWPERRPRRSVTIWGDTLATIINRLFGSADESHPPQPETQA